ncbi:hypothetical protein L6164_008186 [Bauhinia variegata]|uniref:Uncharacterized protein n=1 Tax=Bauhinia variegata TaxID=167791 RepID=A0ACB9PFP0_BAUVA|nr:hypothetical protein L6164_008186 [Bauhinia variegata]
MNSISISAERSSSLPVSLRGPTYSDDSFTTKSNKEEEKKGHKEILGRKSISFAYRVHEHVKLGPKLSETVKGKFSLGARIIQEGGRGNIFKHNFAMKEGEQLLKASLCYLYTTAGPIAGIIFISTEKVAFCSERSTTFTSASGDFIRAPYKVVIPIGKIKEANESENVNNPAQKYIEIVTEDNFEFWFVGFLRHEKAMRNLQKAISMANYQ